MMSFLTSFAVGLVTIAVAIFVYFKISFNYFKSRGIKTLEPSFPFGNIRGFGRTIHQSQALKIVYDTFKGTEKVCGMYFFARPVVVILDLALVKDIMIKDFSNFVERGLYYNEKDDPLSAHLFAIDGTKWKQLRAKLTPTFTSGKMKFMFPTVVEVGTRFRECLAEVVSQHDVLEVKELLARFTTDVIGTCAFGIECNSLNDPNAEFRKMGRLVFGEPRHNTLSIIAINGYKNLARKLHVKNIRDDVSKFFMGVVKDTVEHREKNNVSRNDFMDILIKLKNEENLDDKLGKLTLNEIAAQAFVFFAAGFETSSTTLTFCLYELAVNPEIQRKTRDIIRKTLKRHEGKFTYEAMMDMPYIDHVLQGILFTINKLIKLHFLSRFHFHYSETMRKYPPVSNLNRVARDNYKIPDSNFVIEKGTSVIIPAYAIQRDEEYYPKPEQFDPDRFSSEELKKRDLMTWLPFGEGPRNCIGLRFGMMQARIGLVCLLNSFEFDVCDKTSVPLVFTPNSFILSPDGGLYLKVKPIK